MVPTIAFQCSPGQTTNHLFMEVGERYLELFGSGDLEIFGTIIGTLRFVESGS
jgi:hypothetical protein